MLLNLRIRREIATPRGQSTQGNSITGQPIKKQLRNQIQKQIKYSHDTYVNDIMILGGITPDCTLKFIFNLEGLVLPEVSCVRGNWRPATPYYRRTIESIHLILLRRRLFVSNLTLRSQMRTCHPYPLLESLLAIVCLIFTFLCKVSRNSKETSL